jgi:alpha-galactosidase
MGRSGKIVFLGATTMSFGLNMLRDVFASGELAGSTLTLVSRNAETLARMAELAVILNRASGAGLRIEHTTDRRAALDGAGFVVNATAVDRLRMWKLDFDIPRKYGIRHTLGENGGPGGLFFTLRTLPLVFDIIRDMEDKCPDALFLNFSNPESRIILALGRYSRIRALGLCHGIFMAQDDVARIMGLPAAQVKVWGAGLNHFQWLLHIRDRASGTDLYPLLRAKERTYDSSFAPLSRRLFRAFGYWPTCSDEHLGEYLAYGWEGGETGYDFARDARDREEFGKKLDAVLAGSAPLPPDWLTASGERGAHVIGGVLHDRKRFIESGIVCNRGAIPNVEAEAAVEVPIVADAAGVHPISLGPLPDAIAMLLATQVAVQELAVEAAVHASKEIALQALLIDPVVNSADAAVRLLDELWEANRP